MGNYASESGGAARLAFLVLGILWPLVAKVGATPLDVQAIDYLRSQGCEPAVVATKIDRLPRSKRQGQLNAISQTLSLSDANVPTPCSSKSGEGVKEIWKGIYAFLRESAEMVN